MKLENCHCCGQEREVLEFADLQPGDKFNWIETRGAELIKSGDDAVHPCMKVLIHNFGELADPKWMPLGGPKAFIVYGSISYKTLIIPDMRVRKL